jgi:hypothetical protein
MADALHTPGATSAADARLADAGLIATHAAGMAVRTGVLIGPGATTLVTGTPATAPMTVNVAAHHWVTTRGAADGVYRGAAEAVKTVNIAAAPASNSRIDVIYVKQNDSGSTVSPDGSTGDVYAVAQGTAAATPTRPALPVGAEELGTVTIAAGATSTNGAGVTITNTARLTAGRGAPIPVRNQAERDALTAYPSLKVFRLDLGIEQTYSSAADGWLPTEWVTLPVFSGFHTVGGFQIPRLRKDATKRVYLDGFISNDNPFSPPSSTVVTLPAGFRPTTTKDFALPCSGQPGGVVHIDFQASGNSVMIRGAAVPINSLFDLASISFPTD